MNLHGIHKLSSPLGTRERGCPFLNSSNNCPNEPGNAHNQSNKTDNKHPWNHCKEQLDYKICTCKNKDNA